MSAPLAGVRVVDISHVIAGPLSTFYLAQLGAEVIKIEPPVGGDVMRRTRREAGPAQEAPPPGFTALNAGKRSVALDFRVPEGREALLRLVRTADVFVENFRPGVMARYGLDHASIAAVRPDIVYCSISGYGQQGEFSPRGAYDHVVQALTGMMMMNGEGEDAAPMKVGFPVIDVATGITAALAIVASLMRRMRDGKGERIDASLVQGSLALMYPMVSTILSGGDAPPRLGNRGYTGSPAADTFECADGWLATAANTPAQFRKLAGILGESSLCEDPRALDLDAFNSPDSGFVVARDAALVRGRLADALRTRAASEMERLLNDAGIPAARVRRLAEFLEEAVSERSVTIPRTRLSGDSPAEVWNAGLGFRLDSFAPRESAPAPRHGADTVEVLAASGTPAGQIEALLASGAAHSSSTPVDAAG